MLVAVAVELWFFCEESIGGGGSDRNEKEAWRKGFEAIFAGGEGLA